MTLKRPKKKSGGGTKKKNVDLGNVVSVKREDDDEQNLTIVFVRITGIEGLCSANGGAYLRWGWGYADVRP